MNLHETLSWLTKYIGENTKKVCSLIDRVNALEKEVAVLKKASDK